MTQAIRQAPPEFTPHDALTPPVPAAGGDNLRAFATALFEGAAPVLGAALHRAVTARLGEPLAATPAELAAGAPLPWLLVEAPYQRGLEGRHWLLLDRTAAAALGRALTGQPDGEGEIAPAAGEAVREVVGRMLRAAGPALGPLFARPVAFAAPAVHVVTELGGLPPGLEAGTPLTVTRAQFHSEDSVEALLLLTDEALARAIAALGQEEVEGGAEPGRLDGPARLDLILDVTLPVTVELGRARLMVQDILKLAPGSVIELDKAAGEPVDLLINDRPIARGEVVVIDENFGIRLTSIVTASERIRSFR